MPPNKNKTELGLTWDVLPTRPLIPPSPPPPPHQQICWEKIEKSFRQPRLPSNLTSGITRHWRKKWWCVLMTQANQPPVSSTTTLRSLSEVPLCRGHKQRQTSSLALRLTDWLTPCLNSPRNLQSSRGASNDNHFILQVVAGVHLLHLFWRNPAIAPICRVKWSRRSQQCADWGFPPFDLWEPPKTYGELCRAPSLCSLDGAVTSGGGR